MKLFNQTLCEIMDYIEMCDFFSENPNHKRFIKDLRLKSRFSSHADEKYAFL